MNVTKAIEKIKFLHPIAFTTLRFITVWVDTGTYYRNLEFGHYVLHELLVDYNLVQTKLNYFGGKVYVIDCMFGHISGFLIKT